MSRISRKSECLRGFQPSPIQTRLMAKGLNFRIWEVKKLYMYMYSLCNENKGADQMRGYRAADLRLCLCIYKKQVFSWRGSIFCRVVWRIWIRIAGIQFCWRSAHVYLKVKTWVKSKDIIKLITVLRIISIVKSIDIIKILLWIQQSLSTSILPGILHQKIKIFLTHL